MDPTNSTPICKTCGSSPSSQFPVPPSPTPHLYHTLHQPDASEVIALRQVILRVNSDKSRLDDEIAHAEAVLNRLHRDHEALHTFITEHDAFLAPVRRLPSEILTRIFALCLLEYETSSLDSRRAPLLLMQVCKGWRETALSTQNLWSSITLTASGCSNASLAKLWLSRAMSLPLTVRLDSEGRPHSKVKRLHRAIAVLVQFCDRWKDLDIALPFTTMSCLDSIRHRLPLLESLRICYQHSSERWHRELNLFDYAPRLRGLCIKGRIPYHMLKIPWHQLTELDAPFHSIAECFETLQLSLSLIKCTVDNSFGPSGDISDPESRTITIQFPHMRFFKITSPDYSSDIFSCVKLPILHELHVAYQCNDFVIPSWLPQQPFLSLLSHSSRTLRKLKLGSLYKYTDSAYIAHCLRSLPSLTELSLRGWRGWLTADLLGPLTRGPLVNAGNYLVPNLEVLEIHDSAIDIYCSANMIESRWWFEDDIYGGARLTSVRFELQNIKSWLIEPGILRKLLKFRHGGMDIEIISVVDNIYLLNDFEQLTGISGPPE